MFLTTVILNFITSYLIASYSSSMSAIFVSYFALVVLNIEVLSMFHAISAKNILIFSVVNLILVLLFSKYKKIKLLKPNFSFKRLKNALFQDKSLIILLVCFLVFLSISTFLSFVMPPIEPDSQQYHFYRAFIYSKNHTLSYFDTSDIRALIMPFNSEIIYTWIYTLREKLHGYALLSLVSYFATLISLWEIFEKLKLSYKRRLFSIFILSSFLSLIVEVSSIQTDIVIGALFLSSLALYMREKPFFSSLALSLALGVKTTALIICIPYLVFVFVLNKKIFWRFLSYSAMNFLIFSSYNYIQNYIHYQNPMTNHAAYLEHALFIDSGIMGAIKGFFLNVANFTFRLFIPNLSTDEQVAGFGMMWVFGFLPSIFFAIKNKKKVFFFLSLLFMVNILILSATMRYMPYSMRFVLSFLILSSPILVFLYKKKGFYKWFLTIFCAIHLVFIPQNIKRAPLYPIIKTLRENNFNLENLEDAFFRGRITVSHTIPQDIEKTLKTYYKDAGKIAYFKQKSTVAFELNRYGVDFLTSAYIDKYNLKNYDVVIVEEEAQDDDVFQDKEIELNYDIKDREIIFYDKNKVKCFYMDMKNNITKDKSHCAQRICYGKRFMDNNRDFVPDIYQESEKTSESTKDTGIAHIYFYKRKQ